MNDDQNDGILRLEYWMITIMKNDDQNNDWNDEGWMMNDGWWMNHSPVPGECWLNWMHLRSPPTAFSRLFFFPILSHPSFLLFQWSCPPWTRWTCSSACCRFCLTCSWFGSWCSWQSLWSSWRHRLRNARKPRRVLSLLFYRSSLNRWDGLHDWMNVDHARKLHSLVSLILQKFNR